MKKQCKSCGHRCHCKGNGYYVSTNQCSCDCKLCLCEPLVLKNKPSKKWWEFWK